MRFSRAKISSCRSASFSAFSRSRSESCGGFTASVLAFSLEITNGSSSMPTHSAVPESAGSAASGMEKLSPSSRGRPMAPAAMHTVSSSTVITVSFPVFCFILVSSLGRHLQLKVLRPVISGGNFRGPANLPPQRIVPESGAVILRRHDPPLGAQHKVLVHIGRANGTVPSGRVYLPVKEFAPHRLFPPFLYSIFLLPASGRGKKSKSP